MTLTDVPKNTHTVILLYALNGLMGTWAISLLAELK